MLIGMDISPDVDRHCRPKVAKYDDADYRSPRPTTQLPDESADVIVLCMSLLHHLQFNDAQRDPS